MVPLGRKNLFEDIPRFLVAQAGVLFAVGLVAIQLGIFDGFVKSAGLAIDESSADIWVAAKEMLYFELTLPMPYQRLAQAARVPGVARAEPMIVQTTVWRGPDHKAEYIRVIGFHPSGALFVPGPVTSKDLAALRAPNTALVDRSNLKALNVGGIGGSGRIGASHVRIVALTHGTQPIISATFIFASLENARTYLAPPMPRLPFVFRIASAPGGFGPGDNISYILVKATPGANISALKARLDAALPGTRAYTKLEMADRTRAYWRKRTGLGFVLGLGALVGFIVGMAVVGQILYTSVADHIKEYGTLKAIGAPDRLFYAIVIEQAALMALTGYVPGIGLSLLVAVWAQAHRGILILITPATAALVFGVTLGMCILAGGFAVQRALRVDPAIVFKA